LSFRVVNIAGIITTAVALIGIPVAFANYQKNNLRNVRTVAPGILYRSGQLSHAGLTRVIYDFDIHTVVSLRDNYIEGACPPDAAEADFCKSLGMRHVRIAPKSWWPEYDGPPPAQKGVATFLQVMDDPTNYPVLLHCFAGTHRTGAMVAVYRMEYGRWTNSEALAELRDAGYKNLDRELDVLTYLENYRPRWRSSRLIADSTIAPHPIR
jgi:protein tyrosine/serine phosphatase